MRKLMVFTLALSLSLLSSGVSLPQSLKITENLRHETVALPLTIPDRARMIEIDRLLFAEAAGAAGMLLFYDDPATKGILDYIEFYDLEGHLLLVSWIDRFGICQAAMDRGLLDEKNPRVDRTLVTVALGMGL